MTASDAARASILSAVRAARPVPVPEPDVAAATAAFPRNGDGTDLVERFARAARAAGATVLDAAPATGDDGNAFLCAAAFGVAENGAVWLDSLGAAERTSLFLATDVVVQLDRRAIVPDMHAAYARIDLRAVAFGVFMLGPSKTADIEQSLVIGAQGPMRVAIVLR